MRGIDSDYSDPLVFNVSDGWRIFPWMNLLASGVTEDYRAAGARTEFIVYRWLERLYQYGRQQRAIWRQ